MTMILNDVKHKLKIGWTSTKLHLALITMALMTAGYLLAVLRLPTTSSVDGLYTTFVMGLLAGAAIYSGSNVASSVVTAKTPPAAPPAS
jgi:hypothetical protein